MILYRVIKYTTIALTILLFLFAGFGFLVRLRAVPAILMYHYVIDTPEVKHDKRIVRPQTLERQLRFLKRNQYDVISLEELVRRMKNHETLSRNTVVLTFDDGHLNDYTQAYPLLEKYRVPATMFIIVDRMSLDGYVTREDVVEMHASGLVTIGSHALQGEHLPTMTDKARIRREVFDSKKKLDALLGAPVNVFSYPIGGFTKEIRQLVIDAGYRGAVSTSPGVDYPDDDVYALKRVRISDDAGNFFIFWFESSGVYRYLLSLRKKYLG